jgi:peptidoglycan/xylan/chitin deacetylase (PgdA/CDA1 family)
MIVKKHLKKLRYLLVNRALVLMYHRIADIKVDPWQLAVSPANFENQLQVLKKYYNVIPVDQLIFQLKNKSLASKTVCLTFDDGYCDNYLTAKPLLEKYDCPATFFIPTQYIGQEKLFWWDELQHIILGAAKLPKDISLIIKEEPFKFSIEGEEELTEQLLRKQVEWVFPNEPSTKRCMLYLLIWERLRPLEFSEIIPVLNKIKRWANFTTIIDKSDIPMTSLQLKDITKQPLFSIGVHTVSHPALSSHPWEVQQKEISESKGYLENNLGWYMSSIAFPYGKFNEDTINIAKEQNLSAAFTTNEQVVSKQSDIYRLGRFQVKNWDGQMFKEQLSNWLIGP